MKNKTAWPHVTLGSVLDDLDFSPAEALELKIKADIYRDLLSYIREREFGQQELAATLGIHQPDASNLLNGRVSKFSIARLVKFAGSLGLEAKVTLTRPGAIERRQKKRRLSAAA